MLEALPDEAHALAHLLDAAQIAVVAVAVLAHRYVEIELVIDLVGLRLAQIPGDVGAAQHDAGEPPVHGVLGADDTDVAIALLEDAVLGEESLDVVDDLEERIAPCRDVLGQPRREVLVHPADAVVGGVQARAAHPLVEDHQLLALLEAPQRRGQRADIHALRGHVEQVVEDAADLVVEHADEAGTTRDLDIGQLLGGEDEGMLLVHGRDVVQAVEIGHRLEVGLVLDELLRAAMQQSDVRVGTLNDLPVELEHQAQHPMGGRMLRPEIERHVLDAALGHTLSLPLPGPGPSRRRAERSGRPPTGS